MYMIGTISITCVCMYIYIYTYVCPMFDSRSFTYISTEKEIPCKSRCCSYLSYLPNKQIANKKTTSCIRICVYIYMCNIIYINYIIIYYI